MAARIGARRLRGCACVAMRQCRIDAPWPCPREKLFRRVDRGLGLLVHDLQQFPGRGQFARLESAADRRIEDRRILMGVVLASRLHPGRTGGCDQGVQLGEFGLFDIGSLCRRGGKQIGGPEVGRVEIVEAVGRGRNRLTGHDGETSGRRGGQAGKSKNALHRKMVLLRVGIGGEGIQRRRHNERAFAGSRHQQVGQDRKVISPRDPSDDQNLIRASTWNERGGR